MKRLAEMQNDGPVHRHTVVLADAEADDVLQAEATLHSRAGWTVETLHGRLVCTKDGVVRSLWIENYDPMEPVT